MDKTNNLNTGIRIAAMAVDHFIMTFVIMIFVAPGMVYDLMQAIDNSPDQPKLFLGNYYLTIFAFSLYYDKDIFSGRSPAKRILRLQIVDVRTNRPANAIKCVIRNLTLILWPIEAVVGLINNERRIGDYIAGTKLAAYDPEQHVGSVNWVITILAVLISTLATYLIMFYPIELLFRGSGLGIGY